MAVVQRRGGRVIVRAALMVALVAAAVACGSRVEDTTAAGLPAGVAPTTFVLPTSSTLPLRDVTKSIPSAPTTSAASPPSSTASTTAAPTTAVASTATTTGFDKASFCAASKVYAIDNVIGLGTRVVGDPAGLLAAYETMVASAPPDLADPVKALGPITHEAVAVVQNGQIKTAEKLQTWLADTAPRADLEQWVVAQQTIAPAVKTICQ